MCALRRSSSLSAFFAALLCGAAAISQQVGPSARIVHPIDEKQLVTLKGTMHPLANARTDRGAAPDEMRLDRMHLVLKRSGSQEAALRALITALHTPGTASYHKWLTPDAFGKQFGPADEDITTVETWLTRHGFTVARVNPGKQTLEFSGNVAQFRSAFHAQIHRYEVNGEAHYANAVDPQIPAALAQVVGGFVSLNNFRAKSYAKYLGNAHYDPKIDKATPDWTVGSSSAGYSFVLAPQDYAVQYDLNPLYGAGTNGSGQTIAIVNESNINIARVNSFRSLFGLPANPPQVIIDGNDPGVDGINNPDGPNYASFEAYLDVEWAGAVAPNATVDLVIGADTSLESGLFLAAEHAVYGNIAPVMSLSFGLCEDTLGGTENSFLSSLWEQAATQGITVMVSTGDSGSAGCDDDNSQEYATHGQQVNGFASTPFNVAVGGTDFYYSDFSQGLTAMEAQFGTYWNTTASNSTPAVSIKGVIPEQPWNDSQYGLTLSTLSQGASPTDTSIAAGSGGASSYWTTKPAWQTGFGDAARDLPDLSLFASNGANASYYPICAVDGDCQAVSSGGSVQISGVGGTSASSPSFAGIMALVNQKYGRQGQADFVLYPLEKQFPAAFNDVKNGTNSVPCAYSATVSADSPDCIAVTNPVTITDSNGNLVTEGEIGTGTTAQYNAVAGYDMASGLGTVDAAVLVGDWNKVTFTGTSTTLTPSATSFTHGASIALSGSVTAASGTPTGDVALLTSSQEGSQQGQQLFTLSGGSYAGSISTLPGGTYNIWGQYGGDATNAMSASTPVEITVNPESSGIAFNVFSPTGVYNAAAAPGNIEYGEQLLLSAVVAPSVDVTAEQACILASKGYGYEACPSYGTPTGSVVFKDNGTAVNTAVINAEGEAEYNGPYTIGSHSVAASYAGDNSYEASTATAIPFTIIKNSPLIYLGASNETNDSQLLQVLSGPGQPTVFNIMIENGSQAGASTNYNRLQVAAPTGTVTVSGLPSGVPTSGTLSAGLDPYSGAIAGIATITAPSSTAAGTYGISIAYNGDANYNAAEASGHVQIASTSGKASTTTASMSGSVSPNSSILVTGTVTGAGSTAPTGTVYVYSSGYFIASVAFSSTSGDVSSFSFALNSQILSQGSNFITLQYTGDNTYAPSAYTLNNTISNPLSDFSLIAQTAIVPVNVSGGGAGSGTDVINLASVNGFSGAVNLTCTAASGITCSIAPAAPSLSSGGSATATLTINAAAGTASQTYNVLVTGRDSTGAYVHTQGIEAVVGTPLTPVPSFALSASPSSLTVEPGAATGNTTTITVAPVSSFSSTVNLSCAVSSASDPSNPATCNLASPTVASASGMDVLTVTTTSTSTQGTYLIAVTGTSGSITQTIEVNLIVGSAGGGTFSLAAGAPSPASVAPGGTSVSNVVVSTSSGYSGTVDLACSLTSGPSNLSGDTPLCDLTTSSVQVGTTTPVSVLTIAPVSSQLQWPRLGGKGRGWTGEGAVLAFLVFLGIPARRRSWRSMLGMLIAMAAFGSLAACGGGGGGGSTNTGNPGTAAGNYVFTVTGTGSPAVSPAPTTTFTVVVN